MRGYVGDTPAERRAARRAAKVECKARRAALKQAIPAARKQLDAAIATARADLAARVAKMRADFAANVREMRAASTLRACVDMVAPPAPKRFGPPRPKGMQRPEGKRRKATRERRSARFEASQRAEPYTITGGGRWKTLAAAENAAKSAARQLRQPIAVSEWTGAGWKRHGTFELRGAVVVRREAA